MELSVIILAAGQGRRLRAKTPKPLLSLAGVPLLAHLLATVKKIAPAEIIVVTPPSPAVAERVQLLAPQAVCVEQATAEGTAAAVRCGLAKQKNKGVITLVLCADVPLVSAAKMRQLIKQGRQGVGLLSFVADNPAGYGRLVCADNNGGEVMAIVEHRDADAKIRAIKRVYSGVMACPSPLLRRLLQRIGNDNAAGEQYLTDIVGLAVQQGIKVGAVEASAMECAGVNTAADLARLERWYQQQQAEQLMAKGVRLADPARLDVRGKLTIKGGDIFIDANVIFAGNNQLAADVHIGANCVITDCQIGEGTVIEPFSHLHGAIIGQHCHIGPHARLRPHTRLQRGVRVGNFVEVKNSWLKEDSKASHLAYIGDTQIGCRTNVGAGVITCNYDGTKKHRSTIGDDVFIGSDSQIISPVKIGNGALVAAGTTVTKNVPAQSLVFARMPQKNKPRKDKP